MHADGFSNHMQTQTRSYNTHFHICNENMQINRTLHTEASETQTQTASSTWAHRGFGFGIVGVFVPFNKVANPRTHRNTMKRNYVHCK